MTTARPRRRGDAIARLVFIAGFAAAAVSHAAAALQGEPPALRHALFTAINLTMAVLVRASPRAALIVAVPLTVQQLFSHGASFIDALASSRFDWASLGVLAFFPALVTWLIAVNRAERSPVA